MSYPTLNPNEITGVLYNQIISQTVFADNVDGFENSLVNRARVEGSKFGDTKTYFSTDVLKSQSWGNDAEASNLLNLHRGPAPETQAIVIDQFRYIALTIDRYMSARAWRGEGVFNEFLSVLTAWINDTKVVYDESEYNTFIGNEVTDEGKQLQSIDLSGSTDRGLDIARALADLMTDVTKISRYYNDYGFLRKKSKSSFTVVWNSAYVNEIIKKELPAIYHNDKLFSSFDNVLPDTYFGEECDDTASSGNLAKLVTAGQLTESSGTYTVAKEDCDIRARHEMEVEISSKKYDVFAGQPLPVGYAFTDDDFDDLYVVDHKVICKIIGKLPPIMSGFLTKTSFFNPLSLTENNYTIWSRNTLQHLKGYAFITVKEA